MLLLGVGCLVCLGTLVLQNLRLRNQSQQAELRSQALLENNLANAELTALVGSALPEGATTLHTGTPSQPNSASGYVVIAYNPTVCITCLRDGLRILKENREEVERKGLEYRAIVGQSRQDSQGERRYSLQLQLQGLLDFPVTYVDAEVLGHALPFVREERYIETPLYFLSDGNWRIQAAFKPDRKNPELLDRWLWAISKSEAVVSTGLTQ